MTPKLRLGSINETELQLANFRVEEAQFFKNPPENVKLHEVAVAVYVDGRLQFHGGETVGVPESSDMTRSTMFKSVLHILNDVEFKGKVAFTECDSIPQ